MEQILYRYLPAEAAIKTLQTGKLKTSKYSEFNDPFELAFRPAKPDIREAYDFNRSLLNDKQFLKKAAKIGNRSIPDVIHMIKADFSLGQHYVSDYKTLSRYYLEKIRFLTADSKARVVCFSGCDFEEKNEILMWSHYACSHTGIRLGFLLNMNKRKSSDLRKIVYSDDRPEVNMLELDNKKISAQIMESYHVKSTAWKYEKEVRILIPIKQCTQDTINGKVFDFVDFDKTELISISVGLKYEKNIDAIKKMMSQYPHAALLRARMHPEEYKLEYMTLG